MFLQVRCSDGILGGPCPTRVPRVPLWLRQEEPWDSKTRWTGAIIFFFKFLRSAADVEQSGGAQPHFMEPAPGISCRMGPGGPLGLLHSCAAGR